MTGKDEKMANIPQHLQAVFGGELDAGTPDTDVEALLGQEGKRIKKGRLGRAMSLSKLAFKGGSRWLADKARDAVGGDEDPEEAQQRLRARGVDMATQMLETFAEMRGAAMKLGQMMSYLGDMMPPEAKKVLTVLQRDAPPMPWVDIEAQFVREFGETPEELFLHFERKPIAAASIGQVHRAMLHDGTEVAVKIQYPGIEEAMRADLKNAKFLGLFQKMFFFRTDTKAIMAEIQERMLDECDYEKEADYQEEFGRRFEGHPWIVVPRVHRMYSTQRVLTTTFYRGRGFYEWLALDPDDDVRARAVRMFYRFYLGSLYMDGLFNCDPHPGNYLFLNDGRIVFLDYGCTRRFPEERLVLWREYCQAVCEDDLEKIHDMAVPIGFFKDGQAYDREAFRELIRYLYQPYLEDKPFDFNHLKPEDTFREMFVDNPNLFKLNMPADAVFLNRIGFGLVSLMTEIGEPLNCRRQIFSYFAGCDPDWPEDPYGPDAIAE